MKKGCIIPIVVLTILLVVCVAAAVTGYVLLQQPASKLLVLFDSPRSGERVALGQGTVVHAVARGDQKIKRVEFWVDGKLYDAQNTPLVGGISPFPVLVDWRPSGAGAHTLVVRAFDIRGGRANAAISVEASENQDRDGDQVLDTADRCPDQPGSASNGGCPAVSATDRDGDGISDTIDICPDQSGTMHAHGCPDADNDGVPDSADTCPTEVGSAERGGCPLPGDTDADGVPDASDACPSEPGTAALSGCSEQAEDLISDRDRDGVGDVQDLCPDVPGPASNSGCPPSGTGDRDGDGVDDGTDLAPSEAGSAADGGAPPPGGDTDADRDDIPDDEEAAAAAEDVIPDGSSWEALNLVRIDALEFSVTQDYSQVYCYVTAPDVAERYGPFDLIASRQWDIVEYMGGANSRTIAVPVGRALDLHIECQGHYGSAGGISIVPSDLGSITRSYAENQWDGHVITERSGETVAERGTAGHSFEVKFRLCFRSCESSEFPPPVLRRDHVGLGPLDVGEHLAWSWSGDEHNITGYRLYINENRHASIAADRRNRVLLALYDPPCGETFEYYVTAYRAHADGFNARESPPSNTVRVAGETCPYQVKVQFIRMGISQEIDDWSTVGGPYYGSFWAMGRNESRLNWRAGECKSFLWTYWCDGWHGGGGQVAEIFDSIRDSGAELSGWFMFAPDTDYVVVQLGENDDLTIGARIMDEDVFSHDDLRLNASQTFRSGVTLPFDATIAGGDAWVSVRVSPLEGAEH